MGTIFGPVLFPLAEAGKPVDPRDFLAPLESFLASPDSLPYPPLCAPEVGGKLTCRNAVSVGDVEDFVRDGVMFPPCQRTISIG